jgi:plastocyanin
MLLRWLSRTTSPRSTSTRAASLFLLAAVGLVGCGQGPAGNKSGRSSGGTSSNSSGSTTGGDSASADSIVIKGFKFSPTPLKVKMGQKVTVTNMDSTTHTITADDGSFDSKDLGQGKVYSFTVAKPGKFTYTCTIHNYMKGEIDAS